MSTTVETPVIIATNREPVTEIDGELTFDPIARALDLRLTATRPLQVRTIVGPRSLLMAFGVGIPRGFTNRLFGDEVTVSGDGVRVLANLNAANFRWECEIALGKGETTNIVFPAASPQTVPPPWEGDTITISYEYAWLLGIRRTKADHFLRVDQSQVRAGTA